MQFETRTIAKLCHVGRVLAVVAIALYLVGIAAPVIFPVEISIAGPDGEHWLGTTDQIPTTTRWAATILYGLPQLFWVWGIVHILMLFSHFIRGEVFDHKTFRHLQWFGAMTMAMALSTPAFGSAAQMLLSQALFDQQTLSVDSDDVLNTLDLLIAGTLVFVLATVFRHAVGLAEEQELTV